MFCKIRENGIFLKINLAKTIIGALMYQNDNGLRNWVDN